MQSKVNTESDENFYFNSLLRSEKTQSVRNLEKTKRLIFLVLIFSPF